MKDSKVRHALRAALAAAGIVGLMAAGPAASAHVGEVVARGTCSADSHWRLVLIEHRHVIGVGFQVKGGDVGDIWRVRIMHNGHVNFLGLRRTNAEGWFGVRSLARNTEGEDGFRARAVNISSEEVCEGHAAI